MRFLLLLFLAFPHSFCVREAGSFSFTAYSRLPGTPRFTAVAETKGDTIAGDFNGDGRKEFAYHRPVQYDKSGHSTGPEYCTIVFSDKRIPPLIMTVYCMEAELLDEGDLDGDGCDEVSVIPFGETDWAYCHLYALRKGNWLELMEPFSVWGRIGQNDIEKDPRKKGCVLINEVIPGDTIQSKKASVRLR